MRQLFADKMLKVTSVAIAVIIWLYIFIILDPAQEVAVRNLPIEIVGVDQLNQNGFSIVSESATELSIKVNGSRKRMGRSNMKSIIAQVDVSQIYSEGTANLPVSVVVPFEHYGITQQEPYAVDVMVERTESKTLDLEITTKNSLAKGYMVGPMELETKQVTIKGPKSVVAKVARAGVTLDYGNADVDIDEKLPVLLYDTAGKEIANIDPIRERIWVSVHEALIHCTVVKLKEVKVEPVFQNDVQLPCSLNIDAVQIYGDEHITSKVETIKTEPISVEKLTSNRKTKVKLVIPEGVKVLEDIAEIEVTLDE